MHITKLFKFCSIISGFLMLALAFISCLATCSKEPEAQALLFLEALKYLLISIVMFIASAFFDEILSLHKRLEKIENDTKKDSD